MLKVPIQTLDNYVDLFRASLDIIPFFNPEKFQKSLQFFTIVTNSDTRCCENITLELVRTGVVLELVTSIYVT